MKKILITGASGGIGSSIADKFLKNNTSLKHEALKTKLIDEKDYNKIVDPKKMIYPA